MCCDYVAGSCCCECEMKMGNVAAAAAVDIVVLGSSDLAVMVVDFQNCNA